MSPRFILNLVVPLLLVGCSRHEEAREPAVFTPEKPAAVVSGAVTRPGTHTVIQAATASTSQPATSGLSSAPAAVAGPEESPQSTSAPLPTSGPAQALPLAVVAARHHGVFTPAQTSVLSQLGEEFLATISAAPPVPAATGITPSVSAATDADPAWTRAQASSDERFRSMFGYGAFNAMLLERAREVPPAKP